MWDPEYNYQKYKKDLLRTINYAKCIKNYQQGLKYSMSNLLNLFNILLWTSKKIPLSFNELEGLCLFPEYLVTC